MLKGIVSFRRLLTMAGSLITFELLFLAYLPSETASSGYKCVAQMGP